MKTNKNKWENREWSAKRKNLVASDFTCNKMAADEAKSRAAILPEAFPYFSRRSSMTGDD